MKNDLLKGFTAQLILAVAAGAFIGWVGFGAALANAQ